MTKYIVLILLTLSISVQAREVSFSWEPMDGAQQYEIQLSASEDFTTPLKVQKLDSPAFSATLDPGKYFYRVRVIDKANHPGKWSNVAPVIVAPPAPDLIKPDSGYETSYYEHRPEIEFGWKAVDLTTMYEIVVKDSTGTEVVRTTLDKTTLKQSLPGGEYQWQVRSVGKSPIPGRNSAADIPSEFSKPWTFKIKKNELDKPVLKTPADKAKVSNHDPIDFTWSQDSHSHFADLKIEELNTDKGENYIFPKLKDQSYKKTIEKGGTYRWSVLAKEDADTPGVSSETREFQVVEDPLFAGNYELELNMSYGTDTYLTTSSLQTMTSSSIEQQSFSAGMHYGLSAGYYVFRSLGFFVSAREAPVTVESLSTAQKELDGQLRLRFGANGFFQEFWFGYRSMDIIEAENNPTSQAMDISTTGPLGGTRISVEINPRLKIQGTGYYYKPLSYSSAQQANLGPFNADVMGGSFGVKWNFKGRWWLGYRYAIERVNAQLTAPLSPPYDNASWGLFRNEPVYLSISYER